METQQLLIVILMIVVLVVVVGGRGDRGDFDGGGGRAIVKVFIVLVFARHCFVYSSCLCFSIQWKCNSFFGFFWTQFWIYWNFRFGASAQFVAVFLYGGQTSVTCQGYL